jgi:hypothetical protein
MAAEHGYSQRYKRGFRPFPTAFHFAKMPTNHPNTPGGKREQSAETAGQFEYTEAIAVFSRTYREAKTIRILHND